MQASPVLLKLHGVVLINDVKISAEEILHERNFRATVS
jgi:hypothetical protein